MKIGKGGAPIFVTRRRIGGIEIIQGTSRIKLRDAEVEELRSALSQLSIPEEG